MTKEIIEEIREIVSKALSQTITSLRRIYNEGDGMNKEYKGSYLVFPQYEGKNEVRISEQELRFVFAEKLSSICRAKKKYFYSVETPTKDDYRFSNKNGTEKIDPIIGEGQSGNFDMAIHDENRRKVCLIEFKSGESVSKQAFMEVLAKLANPEETEGDAPRYIIHMVEDKRSERCVENLKEAIKWLPKAEGMQHPHKEVKYICFSLKPRERKIITNV